MNAETRTIRILAADDHALLRQGIAARLKLRSELGAGTAAELTVPARIAYGTAHRSAGLRLFRKTEVQS